ncbi:SURF1 family protein [Marinimicrobium sp. ABcell2]|uniref:SURF1 family protein n=1 Tax=Marinimicrobium sp. ABcell2 TaxID=3069751 RepID=UPI0027B60F45|nr:SURF1 family protein [Marinimicrobium sp. ABcell2]MDQ2076238.1 SURF1 family protein [Marinimicrobium sp. ABcell2]
MSFVQEPSSPVRLRFSLNWKITAVAALALPLLLTLGFWQLDRGAEKRAIEASFAARQSAPPIELSGDNLEVLEPFQRVIARGQFDNEHTWLLDNKQRRGRVGYEVVSPFQLENGTWILVNRGWLQGTGDRQQLPPVPPVRGERSIFAELATVSHHPMLDASSLTSEWPRVVMAIETDAMAEQLGRPLAVPYLRIAETSPGAFETGWQAVNMTAHTHLGYAFQWFAMAAALVVWFLFANSNVLAWWRSRRSKK